MIHRVANDGDIDQHFRVFSLRINGVLVSAAVLCSLAIIIVSAAKHSTGVDNCTALFSADNTDTTANTICNIWTWIQIGIMGLLFVLVGLCQVRLLLGALDGDLWSCLM